MPCVAAARPEALAALAVARRLAACAAAAPRRAARRAPSPAAPALPPKLAGDARPADSGGSWKSDQSASASPHPEDSASAEQAPPRAAKRARRGAGGASTTPPAAPRAVSPPALLSPPCLAAPRLPVRRALFGAAGDAGPGAFLDALEARGATDFAAAWGFDVRAERGGDPTLPVPERDAERGGDPALGIPLWAWDAPPSP
jgi:hypothetical protein